MIPISQDFNYKTAFLDSNETYIRDSLCVNIEYWCKFREAIHVGTNSKALTPQKNVNRNLKETYLELGKSHYEIINTLGYLKYILCSIPQLICTNHFFLVVKSCKDFYFHIGCLLDNLARIIFIINHPKSPNEQKKKNNNNNNDFLRHWIDWGKLMKNRDKNKSYYKNYGRLFKSKQIREIKIIRNQITHSWRSVMTQDFKWPNIIRYKKNLKWPYDEKGFKKYKKWVSIIEMLNNDFQFIEGFQNMIFARLIKDISKFEKNNNITIK